MGRKRASRSFSLCQFSRPGQDTNGSSRLQRDTLLRYLLDELHSYETDHSDALAPDSLACDADKSLLGEATLIQPVSVEEMRSMRASFDSDIADLRRRVVCMDGKVDKLTTAISERVPLGGTTNTQHTNPLQRKLTIKLPPRITARDEPGGVGPLSTSRAPTIPPAVIDTAAATVAHPSPSSPAHDSASTDSAAIAAQPSSVGNRAGSLMPQPRRSSRLSHEIPTAGLVIPDIPARNPDGSRRPKSESWRDIIKHWTEGDPALGLHTPLQDWPPEWTRGKNRLFAAKYHQRSVIAHEFLQTSVLQSSPCIPAANPGLTHCTLSLSLKDSSQTRRDSSPHIPRLQRATHCFSMRSMPHAKPVATERCEYGEGCETQRGAATTTTQAALTVP